MTDETLAPAVAPFPVRIKPERVPCAGDYPIIEARAVNKNAPPLFRPRTHGTTQSGETLIRFRKKRAILARLYRLLSASAHPPTHKTRRRGLS
jgi:hypothetical protein